MASIETIPSAHICWWSSFIVLVEFLHRNSRVGGARSQEHKRERRMGLVDEGAERMKG